MGGCDEQNMTSNGDPIERKREGERERVSNKKHVCVELSKACRFFDLMRNSMAWF